MIPISKPTIGEAEIAAVVSVLESGILAQGAKTQEFEQKFAAIVGVEHAIATSSGTTALHLALLSHGISAGDEVITSAFTFISAINAILLVGARPVFVDIRPNTFNVDVDQIEALITPRTKAIMPVHMFGLACDMDRLQAIANQHRLALIEDAAQAIGAKYKGKAAGSFGTGCFSLYATKNVTAGEGGMITTNDAAIADRCRLLRSHGMRQRDQYEMLGFNFRISELHAAIGSAQLDRLPQIHAKRRQNAAFLSEQITSVITPIESEHCEHAWHQYTIRVSNGRSRDQAVEQLRRAGVGVGVYYPKPAHHVKHVIEQVGAVSLPMTEQLAGEVLSIPVHPALTQDDLNVIVREVNCL